MNRMDVLEAMYEVIKDSIEWGVSEKEYGMFVDGVVAMTENMIEKEKEKVCLTGSTSTLIPTTYTIKNGKTLDNAHKTYVEGDVEYPTYGRP